jgi:DNA-binding response OmpR family regulator
MIMDKKILFIDDDVEILALLEKLLGFEGYQVFLASNGSEGLHLAYEQHPDLIILDVSMPGQDGFDVCKSLREITSVPIIMLTARTAPPDIKRGFAAGADDYIKKPFSNDELLLRVRALLRRGTSGNLNNSNPAVYNYSDGILKVDLIERSCSLKGNPVSLTATEFNLLSILTQHPNQVLSIRTLLTEVWGDGYSHDKGLLSLYIHQLRQKLMDDNGEHKYIRTEWGKGYCFNPLPKVEKIIATHNFDRRSSDIHNFDRRITDKVKPAKPKPNKWILVFHVILLLILAVVIESIFLAFLPGW